MATRKTDPGFTVGSYASVDIPDYVVAELRYDSGVVVTPDQGIAAPSAAAEAPARALDKVLASVDLVRVVSHFGLKERVLATRAAAVMSPQASVSADYAQSGVMQIVPKKGKDALAIAARLKRANAVWSAYVAPRPVPAGAAEGKSPALSRLSSVCQPPLTAGRSSSARQPASPSRCSVSMLRS